MARCAARAPATRDGRNGVGVARALRHAGGKPPGVWRRAGGRTGYESRNAGSWQVSFLWKIGLREHGRKSGRARRPSAPALPSRGRPTRRPAHAYRQVSFTTSGVVKASSLKPKTGAKRRQLFLSPTTKDTKNTKKKHRVGSHGRETVPQQALPGRFLSSPGDFFFVFFVPFVVQFPLA